MGLRRRGPGTVRKAATSAKRDAGPATRESDEIVLAASGPASGP
ncbi:hypothetical protein ACWCPM_17955 [Streptomyces sp. NPDC002309]